MRRCPVMSSVSGEQCRDVEGHREYGSNRFHRFGGAIESIEKRLAHTRWHVHVGRCPGCQGDVMCHKGKSLWAAMEAHGCTWKSWCALEEGHGTDCVPLDELPTPHPPTAVQPDPEEST